MKKNLSLSIIVTALAGVIFLSTATATLAAKGIVKGIGSGGGSITVSDLNVGSVGALPTSTWYFFKEWGRGLEQFFTFNSIKKAELELRFTNEKAAEALKVQEEKPDDASALATALLNYTNAEERLQVRIAKLKETSENPDMEKLLEKLDEQTLKHANLLNQLAERWNNDPYVEDATLNQIGDPDFDLIANAIKDAHEKISDTVRAGAEKEKNIKEKAAEQIKRAETAIKELESAIAEFAINEPGVPNEKTGPIRLDPTPARISTNMTIERQTPKRDFGDRMKAGLDTAGSMLANAKALFTEDKFGEAFGKARAAEVLARNGLRILEGVLRADVGGLEDSGADRIAPPSAGMPIVPGTGKAGEKTIPEVEKRVFPETNNRTACDDRNTPACPSGKILECREGKWACIGPATSGGIIVVPEESQSSSDGSVKSSE